MSEEKAKKPKKSTPKIQQLAPEKMKAAAGEVYRDVGTKIVTASNVKKFFTTLGLRMDPGVPDQVAKDLYTRLLRAAKRCADNQRTTVQPLDL